MVPTPIVQLQQQVLDHQVPVSTLLRYAMLIATKIKDEEMIEWCGQELNGYNDGSQPRPEYRTVYGEYTATDAYGRDVPVHVEDPKYLELVTKVPVWMSIGELESMLDRAREDSAFKIYLPPKLEVEMKKGMTAGVKRLFRVVQQIQFAQILEAVRNKIFDWTIALQRRGASVDGDLPRLPARRTSEAVSNARTIQTTNYVEMANALQSPVQVGTRSSTQQASFQELDVGEVARLIEGLERDLRRARQDADIRKLLDEIETIKNVLKSPSPKASWLRESLQSIRNILENAAGTVLGEVLKDGPYIAHIGRILGMG